MTRHQLEEQALAKERENKEKVRLERERPSIERIKQLLLEMEKKYTETGYICRKAWEHRYQRDTTIQMIKKSETV